jgi:hypothetical protein
MVTKTKRREMAESRAHVPGEVEARMLLVLGASVDDVSIMVQMDRAQVAHLSAEITKHGRGPYTVDEASRMIGWNYRSLYHAIDRGEVAAKNGTARNGDQFAIPRRTLEKLCRTRLNEDGEMKARYLLFIGCSPRLAAYRGGFLSPQAYAILRELKKYGLGPESAGPYTLLQTSTLLGIQPRMTRRYCEQGRLGRKHQSPFGMEYVITREDLIEFGRKERKRGVPGQVNRKRELKRKNAS